MTKTLCLAGLASIAVVLLAAGSTRGAPALRGQVVRVGFAGSGTDEDQLGGDHYRVGCYTPVQVELSNSGGDTFTGSIEVIQLDRDGDEIAVRRQVMVNGTRRFYLYIPTGDSDARERFTVRVLDTDGAVVTVSNEQNQPVRELMPAVAPARIPNEARVILDISSVNGLRALVNDKQLNRPVVVLRLDAKYLPEEPAGLEMADTIIWDGADAEAMDLPQREALLEWVRRGGHLIIAVSRNWEQLNKSKIAEWLPATLTGTATMTEGDPAWETDLDNSAFGNPLTYAKVKMPLPADSVVIIPKEMKGKTPPLALYRPLGRGHIVMVTTEIRELLDPGRGSNLLPAPFLRRLVGLRSERKTDQDTIPAYRHDLFRYVAQRTGFQVTTQLYLLFAFTFVVGYVLIATGGSWLWLKKRKLVQHAWSAFAAVVLIAAVTSLGAVHLIRGVGHRVQELAVVDMRAGSTDGSAVCYFGLKTAVHTNLDLHLATHGQSVEDMPDNTTELRPLADNPDPFGGVGARGYLARQRYEAVAAAGELRNVPLRATLKQLEGFWRGQLAGRLDAALKRSKEGIDPNSWLQNGLGTDLNDCYLLVPEANSAWPDRGIYDVRCYPIGTLRKSQKLVLGQLQKVKDELDPTKKMERTHIHEAATEWLRDFGASAQPSYRINPEEEEKLDLEQLNKALMALSIFDEIERVLRMQVNRSEGQSLDRSLALNRETALLVGFSNDPGPAWLCWRTPGDSRGKWSALESEDDRRVVYRIAIPVSE